MARPETVVYIATSLDGFIARPDGAIDWLGEVAGSSRGTGRGVIEGAC